MTKTARRKQADKHTAGPFSSMLFAAISKARRLGLYILAEGNPKRPIWHIYDAKKGDRLLIFFPESRVWSVGPNDKGQCRGWKDALDMALKRRG